MAKVWHLTVSDPDDYDRRGGAAEHRHQYWDEDEANAAHQSAQDAGFNAKLEEAESLHAPKLPVTASICEDWCPVSNERFAKWLEEPKIAQDGGGGDGGGGGGDGGGDGGGASAGDAGGGDSGGPAASDSAPSGASNATSAPSPGNCTNCGGAWSNAESAYLTCGSCGFRGGYTNEYFHHKRKKDVDLDPYSSYENTASKTADHAYDDDDPTCAEGDGKKAIGSFLDQKVCDDHLRYYLADAPSQLAKAQEGIETSSSVERLKYENLAQKIKSDVKTGQERLQQLDLQNSERAASVKIAADEDYDMDLNKAHHPWWFDEEGNPGYFDELPDQKCPYCGVPQESHRGLIDHAAQHDRLDIDVKGKPIAREDYNRWMDPSQWDDKPFELKGSQEKHMYACERCGGQATHEAVASTGARGLLCSDHARTMKAASAAANSGMLVFPITKEAFDLATCPSCGHYAANETAAGYCLGSLTAYCDDFCLDSTKTLEEKRVLAQVIDLSGEGPECECGHPINGDHGHESNGDCSASDCPCQVKRPRAASVKTAKHNVEVEHVGEDSYGVGGYVANCDCGWGSKGFYDNRDEAENDGQGHISEVDPLRPKSASLPQWIIDAGMAIPEGVAQGDAACPNCKGAGCNMCQGGQSPMQQQAPNGTAPLTYAKVGSVTCRECDGTGICSCGGEGRGCADCDNTGVCRQCGGSGGEENPNEEWTDLRDRTAASPEGKQGWSIKPLNTIEDQKDEGQRMQHDLGYDDKVVPYAFSLRNEDKSHVTFTTDEEGKVTQAVTRNNEKPKDSHMEIIKNLMPYLGSKESQVTSLDDPYAPKGETETQLKGDCIRCGKQVTAGDASDFGDGKWSCSNCAPLVAQNMDIYKSAHRDELLAYLYEEDENWEKTAQNLGNCMKCGGGGSNGDGTPCGECGGTGKEGGESRCLACSGSGTTPGSPDSPCLACKGTGRSDLAAHPHSSSKTAMQNCPSCGQIWGACIHTNGEAPKHVDPVDYTKPKNAGLADLFNKVVDTATDVLQKCPGNCGCESQGACQCQNCPQAALNAQKSGAVEPQEGVLFGDDGSTYYTTDGGANWDKIGAKEVHTPGEPMELMKVVHKDKVASEDEASQKVVDSLSGSGWTDLEVKTTGKNPLGHYVVNLTGFGPKKPEVEAEDKIASTEHDQEEDDEDDDIKIFRQDHGPGQGNDMVHSEIHQQEHTGSLDSYLEDKYDTWKNPGNRVREEDVYTCSACQGSGLALGGDDDCPSCSGKGILQKIGALDLELMLDPFEASDDELMLDPFEAAPKKKKTDPKDKKKEQTEKEKKAEQFREKNEAVANEVEKVVNKVNRTINSAINPASGPDGTSTSDLVDNVPDLEPRPTGERNFITDHKGEVESPGNGDGDDCRFCGEPMQDHAQWNVTMQPGKTAQYDNGRTGDDTRSLGKGDNVYEDDECQGCGKWLSPVTKAMDSIPYCTNCIRDGKSAHKVANKPVRGEL